MEDPIKEIVSRGVEKVVDQENLEKRLKSGKILRVKLGIDPTSPNLHLGRCVSLLKLRDFQNLGHQAVLIIGDFTAQIGDTSDKDAERPMLSEEQVSANLATYVEQISKVIDVSKAEILYNSKWLSGLPFLEVCKMADVFSVNQFIARDLINRRLEAGKRVSLREVLYPLMQAYDSVVVKADVELGGVDQWFNLLCGRDLQKHLGQEPQDILVTPIIEGTDGRKASSSWGNTINVLDTPRDMFGKLMSIKDELIIKYFWCLTRIEKERVQEFENMLKKGHNPRDIKLELATEIVSFFYSRDVALKEREYFIEVFSNKQTPSDVQEFIPSNYDILTFLVESGLVSSKSEARRVIAQGGVKVDGQQVDSPEFKLSKGQIVQKGKIKFLKVS